MVRDGRLRNVGDVREVAGADAVAGGELAHDGQSDGVGEGRQEANVGIEMSWHAATLSTNFDIDNHQCACHIEIHRYAPRRQKVGERIKGGPSCFNCIPAHG